MEALGIYRRIDAFDGRVNAGPSQAVETGHRPVFSAYGSPSPRMPELVRDDRGRSRRLSTPFHKYTNVGLEAQASTDVTRISGCDGLDQVLLTNVGFEGSAWLAKNTWSYL